MRNILNSIKKNKIKFILFFFLYNILLSQDIKPDNKFLISYKLDYQNNTDSSEYETDMFNLYINDNESKFISINKVKSDSLVKNPNSTSLLELKKIKLKFTYQILFDSKTKKLIETDKIGLNDFFCSFENFDLHWQITNESKLINTIKVTKAISNSFGRKWEAWYAESIPFIEGPYKFKGLPGLVIEVNDLENNFRFSMIEIRKNSNHIFEKNNETLKYAKELSVEKYIDLKKNIYDNPSMIIPNYEILNENLKERFRKIIENKKKTENNPIELIPYN